MRRNGESGICTSYRGALARNLVKRVTGVTEVAVVAVVFHLPPIPVRWEINATRDSATSGIAGTTPSTRLRRHFPSHVVVVSASILGIMRRKEKQRAATKNVSDAVHFPNKKMIHAKNLVFIRTSVP